MTLWDAVKVCTCAMLLPNAAYQMLLCMHTRPLLLTVVTNVMVSQLNLS